MKNNWQTKKLGEICKITTGSSNTVDAVEDGQYAFFDRSKMIKRSGRFLFDGEALIIPGEGQTFFPRYYSGKFDLHQRAYALLDFDENTEIKFVEYFLIFEHKYFERVAVGATAKSLRRRHFEDLQITLPPLSEQKRIVTLLDELFEKLKKAKENAEKHLRNAKKLLESCVENTFSNLTEEFIETKLGEKATFRNGINFTKGSKGALVKIVGVKDFQSNFWIPIEGLDIVTTDGELKEIDVLKEGDIVAVRSNGNPKLIGRCMLAGTILEQMTHSGFTIRLRLNSDEIYPNFLCHYLKSRIAKTHLIESGTGVNIKSLNQKALSSLKIPTPPLIEQKGIVSKLDQLYTGVKKLEGIYHRKQSHLNELKQSILHQVFTGKLN